MKSPAEFREIVPNMVQQLVELARSEGCRLTLDQAGLRELTRFWDLRKAAARKLHGPKEELESLSNHIGVFLGETLAAQWGGDWTLDSEGQPSFRLGGTASYADFLGSRRRWIETETDFTAEYAPLDKFVRENALAEESVLKDLQHASSLFAVTALKLAETGANIPFIGVVRTDGSREIAVLVTVTTNAEVTAEEIKPFIPAVNHRREGDETSLKLNVLQDAQLTPENRIERTREVAKKFLKNEATSLCFEFAFGEESGVAGAVAALATIRASGLQLVLTYYYFRADGVVPRDLDCPEMQKVETT